MKLEVYIAVSVIVDTETGACTLGEIDSESWPFAGHDTPIWNAEGKDGEGTWDTADAHPGVWIKADEFLAEQLEKAPR